MAKDTTIVAPTVTDSSKSEPKVEPEPQDDSTPTAPLEAPEAAPEVVLFQYDRDTSLEATVIGPGTPEGTLDLQLAPHLWHGKKVTPVTLAPEGRVFKNVRPGSKFEPGTYYPM